MESTIEKLENLLARGIAYFQQANPQEIEYKSMPERWSKKEISIHLIEK